MGITAATHLIRAPRWRKRQASADLWIVPHELLAQPSPENIGTPAFVFVDESLWQDNLIGEVEGNPDKPEETRADKRVLLTLDALREPPRVGLADNLILQQHRMKAFGILSEHGLGPVSRQALLLAGFTAEMAAEAERLEWKGRIDIPMRPGMPQEARKELVIQAEPNRIIWRRVLMWRAINEVVPIRRTVWRPC